MKSIIAGFIIAVLISGCAYFTMPPKLPDLPSGAEELAGDGAWEASYDLAVIDWRSRFERYRPFDFQDYWLTEPQTPEAIFAAYDAALPGWTTKDWPDSRNRWIGRSYEYGGRLVAVAIFPAARHDMPHDALMVTTGPR